MSVFGEDSVREVTFRRFNAIEKPDESRVGKPRNLLDEVLADVSPKLAGLKN
jgi:hypothetical protein